MYIDIGNSRIRFASDEQAADGLVNAFDYNIDTLLSVFHRYSAGQQVPARVLVANVAGDTMATLVTGFCQQAWSVMPEYLQSTRVVCGVTNAYINPAQLGVDRWLAIIAAWNKYRDYICIIDCGSAVTVDLVCADGQHQGGYIIPGSYMMQQSLLNSTGQIALATGYHFSGQAGRSTDECVYNGTTYAIAAFIEYIMQSLNDSGQQTYHCVITGGGAEPIMKILKIDFHHEPMLVMTGIRLAGNS
jgi:type III pantothenate kinase